MERCKHTAGWINARDICLWTDGKKAVLSQYSTKHRTHKGMVRIDLKCNLSNHGCKAKRTVYIKLVKI